MIKKKGLSGNKKSKQHMSTLVKEKTFKELARLERLTLSISAKSVEFISDTKIKTHSTIN